VNKALTVSVSNIESSLLSLFGQLDVFLTGTWFHMLGIIVLGEVITIFAVHKGVLVIELLIWHWHLGDQIADQGTSWDRDSPSDNDTSDLNSNLSVHAAVRVL